MNLHWSRQNKELGSMDKRPTQSCDPAKKCDVCDQVGLPILPIRYAICRSDVKEMWQGPRLGGGFGKDVASVTLPASEAHYTLRLARQGYLYVFNEIRGEWKGYQITSDSYLLEFDPHAAPPPQEEFQPTCARMADSQVARFVIIPDPKRAGKVWFGFSEAPWTKEIMERNRKSSERKKHMRCIDVQMWLKGKSLDHVGSAADAPSMVSEFKFGKRVKSESEVKIPMLPSSPPPAADPGKPRIVDRAVETILEVVDVYANPGFSFSFAPFSRCKQDVPGMEAWLQKSSLSARPMMVALNDPAGIAQELSALVRQKTREFEEEDDRGWKHATSVAIRGIRQAIEDQAAAEKLSSVRASAYTGRAAMELYAAGITKMREELTAEEDKKARDSAWDRYRDDYSQQALDQFDKSLVPEMERYTSSHLTPIAQSFVRWYKSEDFRTWLACNHNDELSYSSMRLTEIVDNSLEGVVGFGCVQAALLEDLAGRFQDIKNCTVRALTLNDRIAAEVIEKQSKTFLSNSDNPGAWSNIFKAYAHVLDRGGSKPQELQQGLGLVAGLVFKMSGMFVTALTKAGSTVAKAGINIAISAATRNNLVGLLGVLSGKRIQRVSIRASEREMAHFLVEALSEGQAGVNKRELRARVDQHLRQELSERSGARVATGDRNSRGRKVFEWAVFWDKEAMAAVRNGQPGSLGNMLMSEEQIRVLVRNRAAQYSAPHVNLDVRLGVVGLVLDAWNVADSYGKLDVEKEGPAGRRQLSLASALVGFAGTSVELTGMALAKTMWGRTALASEIRFGAIEVASRAGLVGFLGRLLGTVGGLMGAVVDGWKMYESIKTGDIPMAVFYGTTAVAGAVVAYLMFVGAMTAGVGFIVLLVLGLISMLGEWLINLIRDDKVERWLDMTPFGVHEHGRFESPEKQVEAYNAMLPAGA
ncbi:T6SS effector BTH_I2691 family protein [Stenotrophomonas maltophilia]|nr:T6SS effector BTH_I2691 family protein [Stenotrophomonas maltophilia]MDZ5842437.1 T6SS effector BTH_I2691 family protein [Stenotrophomonas maltophilia]